jgi:hypothetical protein
VLTPLQFFQRVRLHLPAMNTLNGRRLWRLPAGYAGCRLIETFKAELKPA